MTVRETCDIVRYIKPFGEVDFSGEIFFRHAVLSLRGALMCAKEKQAALKETFGFLASLTNMRRTKYDRSAKHGHTDKQYTFVKK